MSSDWQDKAELYEQIAELQEYGLVFICDGMVGVAPFHSNITPARTKLLYSFFENRTSVTIYGDHGLITPKVFGTSGASLVRNFINRHKDQLGV